MVTVGGDSRLARFTRTERVVHWVQATSFIVLLVSGFGLSLPAIESLLGNRDTLREIHLSAAFFLFFGPAIAALAGDRESVARDIREVDRWDADDLHWLHAGHRPQGRFNAGQKLNAIFVVWASLTFTLSGLVMWQNRRFPLEVVQRANGIHTWLAYIALLAVLGHIYLATLHPATRHSLRGIVSGWVRADWAREHHAKWARVASAYAPSPSSPLARTMLEAVLLVAIALFSVRILFFWLGANVTDRVTSWLYGLTAWPGVASITPQTGTHIWDWPAIAYLVGLLLLWTMVDRLRETDGGL